MTILRAVYAGVRRVLGAFLLWLLWPFRALRKPPKRLLTRQEKRAMARKQANDYARRLPYQRKTRRVLARMYAKVYFHRLRGATV